MMIINKQLEFSDSGSQSDKQAIRIANQRLEAGG